MKRIIFIILIVIFCQEKVYAKTYYSKYGNYSDWSDEVLVENELMDVEIEKRYKWYYFDRLDDEYLKLSDNYVNIDYNDFIYTDYSDWEYTEILKQENIEVETRNIYKYQDIEDVRYIKLDNLYGSSNKFRITEIDVFVDGKKINFDIDCNSCSYNYKTFFNNDEIKENMSFALNGSTLYIDLLSDYHISSIKIDLYLFDVTDELKTYDISFLDKDKNIFLNKSFKSNFKHNTINDVYAFSYDATLLNLNNPIWKNEVYTTNSVKNTNTRKVTVLKQYRQREKMYKSYTLKQIYYNDYYVFKKGAISDENLYKLYYRSKKREKFTIDDVIVIKEKGKTIDDFIDSNIQYTINGEIDYGINDNYKIEIILPFEVIKKEVIVDIFENEIDYYKKRIEELEENIADLEEEKKSIELSFKEKSEKCENQKNLLIKKNEEIITRYNEMDNGCFLKVSNLNNRIIKKENDMKELIKVNEREFSNYKNELLKSNLKYQECEKEEKMTVINKKISYKSLVLSSLLFLILLTCIFKWKKM